MSAALTRAARLAAAAALTFGAAGARAQAPAAAPEPERPRLAADADTADWRAYYAWGVAHVVRQPGEAERAFYWASRLNPAAAEPLIGRYVAGWRQQGRLYKQRFDGEEAAWRAPVALHLDSLYMLALDRDPLVNQQLTSVLDDMLVGNTDNNLEFSTDLLTQGNLAYARGDYAKAVRLLNGELGHRGALEARRLRALSYDALGDYPHAAEELRAAVAMLHRAERRTLFARGETAAGFELALGNVYRKAGDADAARAAYARALGEDVSLAAAHVALADLALTGGDAGTAMQEYAMAAEIHPADGGVRVRYADALRVAGEYADAVEQYRLGVALEPHYFVTYLNLGIVLDKLGRRDEAAAAYAQFAARAPRAFAPQVAAVRRRLAAPSTPNESAK